jgi:hypothetical protein
LLEINRKICRLRPVEETLLPERKTAEAIRREVAREVDLLLRVIFASVRKTGRLDLEAVEMAVRSALHRAGAAALTEVLRFPAPADDQRQVPCACGHAARYQGLRSKPLLPVLGPAEVSRPYYRCSQCGAGQFPADAELDIRDKEFSPGVRRMQALVGQELPFDHGRQQLELLAGLEVSVPPDARLAPPIVYLCRPDGRGRHYGRERRPS